MKIKKLLAVLSACIMITGVMTGCGDDDSKSETTTTTAASTTAEDGTTAPAETTTEAPTQTEPPKPVVTADANAITFENGDLYTANVFVETGASECNLSVAEYNGSKMLKVEVLSKDETSGDYLIPKIKFDLVSLIGAENLPKIYKVTADLYQVAVGDFVNDEGVAMKAPANFIGTIGLGGVNNADKWVQMDYEGAEWNWDWVYIPYEGKILLPANRYTADSTDAHMLFMRWGQPNQADIYMDNITFWDDQGNSIPLAYTPAQ